MLVLRWRVGRRGGRECVRASFSALVSLARSEVDRVRIYRCELRNTTSGTDVELTGKLSPWVILEPASDGSRDGNACDPISDEFYLLYFTFVICILYMFNLCGYACGTLSSN